MLEEDALEALTLNALARRVGLAKSNVYRYFESREAILLEMVRGDFEGWVDELSTRLRRLRGKRRPEKLARLMATTAAERPTMCQLMSVLGSVLEHNVSLETVRAFKIDLFGQGKRLTEAMHEAVPELSLDDHDELIRYAYSLLIGLWPATHPPPVVQQLMQEPAFANHAHDFEAEFTRGVLLVAEGLLRRAEG